MSRRMSSSSIVLGLSLVLSVGTLPSAWAYTPESPEVQSMVARGVAFIEKNIDKGQYHEELGGLCVAALACYTATGNPQHPIVLKAVAECNKGAVQGFPTGPHANYSLGLALIFLGELDPQGHRVPVDALLAAIYKNQRPDGAWSYPNYATGDTSQTQYACLGMWMAHRQGIQIDISAIERVTNWLIRTQAPNGSFGYQGNDPGTFNRVPQERTTNSMGAAGTGSLYVCGELLGFVDDPRVMRRRLELPPAIVPVIERDERFLSKNVDRGRWQLAVKDGNSWFTRNAGVENIFNNAPSSQYYYMYTVERYWAFRELAEAINEAEPKWYNIGVDYLIKKQEKDGAWAEVPNGPLVGTSFAILYLLRSSKKTVTRLVIEQGRLTGGKGLNTDLSTATVNSRGQVVTADPAKSVSELLAMLEDPSGKQAEFDSEVPAKIVLSDDPVERERQLERFRRMIINGSYQARLTAANTMGTVRDLKCAPSLIFALSDPDFRVVRAARDALRFMSRKPEGFGLQIEGDQRPEQPQWKAAQANWTKWLLSVQPDAELIE